MRKILALTTAALLITLPAPLLAQHHGGGGGGGGGHPGGGGGHPGGGGGHPGGGGGFHGGGAEHGGGGQHFGGGHPGGGGFNGGGNHFGAEHRQSAGSGGHAVVINNTNRTVVRNESVRGGGDRANFAGGGRGGGHGLPAGPPRGGWHQGWYGGNVGGFQRVHAGYYRYPSGFGYRRWGIGLVLPAVLFGSAYYYYNWHSLGAYPPPPGDRWVRYGPDLLLINVPTGRVDDAIYGAFY